MGTGTGNCLLLGGTRSFSFSNSGIDGAVVRIIDNLRIISRKENVLVVVRTEPGVTARAFLEEHELLGLVIPLRDAVARNSRGREVKLVLVLAVSEARDQLVDNVGVLGAVELIDNDGVEVDCQHVRG